MPALTIDSVLLFNCAVEFTVHGVKQSPKLSGIARQPDREKPVLSSEKIKYGEYAIPKTILPAKAPVS